jgi:hypothetical protein
VVATHIPGQVWWTEPEELVLTVVDILEDQTKQAKRGR